MTLPPGARLPSFWQTLSLIVEPIKFLESCAKKYGDFFTLYPLGQKSSPTVFFSHPQAIEQIFTTVADKLELGKIVHVFRPLTGDRSLIMLDGEEHHQMRQLLMPPLHGKRIQIYRETIQTITEETFDRLSVGSSFSIRDVISDISLEIILQVVFGLNSGRQYKKLKDLISKFLAKVTSPLYSIQFFWTPLQQDWGSWSFWGQFVLLRQQIDEIVYAEITARRSLPPGEDILSLLMSVRDEGGELLTDEQLRDQLMTLLLLGHETTASAVAWSFYWIHCYPSVKKQLRQELKDFGTSSPAMNTDRSSYLNAVCQEALRIYPIALISQPRVVKETVTIQNYQFVPGTILVPCIYLAHRRQQTFAEPDRFIPERFLQRKFSPYEYFPFGGGNRSCIGAALSMLEMKIILSTVLANYDLELVNKKEVKPVRRGITIVPKAGCQMKLVASATDFVAD